MGKKAWPPQGQLNEHRPHAYLTRVTNDKAKRVEWPPKEPTEMDVTDGGIQGSGAPQYLQHGFRPQSQDDLPSNFKLRENAPLEHVEIQPVVVAQPAFKMTAPLKVSGDQVWPPNRLNDQTQSKVREIIRPHRDDKGYDDFFAQSGLPNQFIGYRIPPGTQHHTIYQ